jgi:hypothetical protein
MGRGGNGGEDERGDSERSVAENSEDMSEGRGRAVAATRASGRLKGRGKKRRRVPCPRGGKSGWTAAGAVEDSQGLPKPCALVLASLSSQGNLLAPTTLDSQAHRTLIVEMRNMLSGESWKESQLAFQVNSLENIILRCQRAEKVEIGVQFISMVNFIQLAAKVERYNYSFKAFNCFTQSLALAFENPKNYAVEQKSCVWNY